MLTGDVVTEDARRDDSAVRGEELLEVLLGHGLGQSADVQVGALNRLAARAGVRHLEY